MRVLFVMTGADTGGAERLVAMLGRNWPAEDTTGLMVMLGRGTLSAELESSFGSVRYLDIDPRSRRLDRMVRAVESGIRDFRPDVVASHMFHADLVVALSRTPAAKVSTIHTLGLGPRDRLLTKVVAKGVGLVSRRFEAVVPVSEGAQMQEFLGRMKMRNVVDAVPNATEIPPSSTFKLSSRVLLSVGRNHPVKGHPVLLEAFGRVAAHHPDWRLRLVGPGVLSSEQPFTALLEQEPSRSLHGSGRITLEGPTTHPEGLLQGSAALVIASLYGETTPMVGLEATAHGIPVVTTAVGSAPSFVDDARFVAAPGDVDDLARALDAYMSLGDGDRAHLSELARTRAERSYRPQLAVERYRAVFAEAVLRRGR